MKRFNLKAAIVSVVFVLVAHYLVAKFPSSLMANLLEFVVFLPGLVFMVVIGGFYSLFEAIFPTIQIPSLSLTGVGGFLYVILNLASWFFLAGFCFMQKKQRGQS